MHWVLCTRIFFITLNLSEMYGYNAAIKVYLKKAISTFFFMQRLKTDSQNYSFSVPLQLRLQKFVGRFLCEYKILTHLGKFSRRMITGLYGKTICHLARNCHTVFQNGRTILHLYQQCTNVSIFSTFSSRLVVVILIIVILRHVKWQVTIF